MATTDIPLQADSDRDEVSSAASRTHRPLIARVLAPLASLRLTVVLLSMAVFIVLAGTLAQAEMGIETVVNEYFRVRPWGLTLGFAWIPFQIFLPESFFPSRPQVPGGIWFPGGWLIGLAMFVNLLAAHSLRFTVQAKETRVLAGLGVVAFGILVTAGVVASGSGVGGLQGTPILEWNVLWNIFRVGIVTLAVANVAAAVVLHKRRPVNRPLAWIVTAAIPAILGLAVWSIVAGTVGDSSMRILWQLIKATGAALILLAGCWLLFRKRSGIVLLHAGVGLLMISELLVGLVAVETQMTLGEGETKNWAQDIRTVELAVVDPSNQEYDVLTRFPASRLEAHSALSHDSIPFQIRVDRFYGNSRLIRANQAKENPADAGAGQIYVAEERPEVAGTSTGGGVDYPAVYVTLLTKDGQERGKYLLSALLSSNGVSETIRFDDEDWRVSLRFKRDYKPYAVTLVNVEKDDYVGTDTPKNYSSDVHVASESLGVNFDRHIWMNNPLRFAGETLYQSGYHRGEDGREFTTLQIVKNTGWMLPYVACMIVAVGMAAQFLITLSRFLRRRAEAQTIGSESTPGSTLRGGRLAWAIPAAVVIVFGGWLGGKFAPPRVKPSEPNLVAFGSLPITSHGRVKPIDTVARDALKALSNNRQEYKTGNEKKRFGLIPTDEKKPAVAWLLHLIAAPEKGAAYRVVRIDSDELKAVLQLPNREDFLYSIQEVSQAVPALATRVAEVRAKSAKNDVLSASDRAALDLERKLGVIDLLLASFRPNVQAFTRGVPRSDGTRQSYADWYSELKNGDMTADPAIPSRNPPLAVFYRGDWETLGHAQLMEMVESIRAEQAHQEYTPDPAVDAWTRILDEWEKGEASGFNAAVMRYQTLLDAEPPKDFAAKKIGFEAYFNHAAPFYYLMIPYVVAGLLAACSWLGFGGVLNRTAFWLVVMTFVLHTLALAGRIYISGRPPVTNLYSSAVFIGWAAVAFGIVLERVYWLGFGNVMAGVIGFATLLVAHNLSGDGSDTFSVLQAVLDTQFWLATHVVTVTLGYAATYVAGFLGLLYILLGLTTPKLGARLGEGANAQTIGQALVRMTYGVLCFAILFSFVGTVLGGLWADDSWGRFWGWDPKENGALIIVLWNAVVLHARWGGLVKDRGLAVLAVAGNIAVSWSWFGTNELGVGLHSYGFTDGVLLALGLFVLSQLLVVIAGCLPKSLWRSFRDPAAA